VPIRVDTSHIAGCEKLRPFSNDRSFREITTALQSNQVCPAAPRAAARLIYP